MVRRGLFGSYYPTSNTDVNNRRFNVMRLNFAWQAFAQLKSCGCAMHVLRLGISALVTPALRGDVEDYSNKVTSFVTMKRYP